MFKRPEDKNEIFRKLDTLFSQNLKSALLISQSETARVELKSRCLKSIGQILASNYANTSIHKEIALIYDEVFADCICSVYLAAQGLDRPAQLVLRRVLELGIAAIYLWDLPQVYCGWKLHDKDLSFTEMLDQVSSLAYISYVNSLNGSSKDQLCNTALAKIEYRRLSNTIHGKIATFETPLNDRFQHSDTDWKLHIVAIEGIQDILIDLAQNRFANIRSELPKSQPELIPLL